MTTPHDARPVEFEPEFCCEKGPHMRVQAGGRYVKTTDYDALRSELDRRTSDVIVHNGQMLACSEPVMDAYESLRSEVALYRSANMKYAEQVAHLIGRTEAAEARIEAMADYRTHHHDWRLACEVAFKAAQTIEDADYWVHQIKTLDALNAQGDEGNG